MLQGKEEGFQYGPGFGGPGKGIPPECPSPFAIQTVPFYQLVAFRVLQVRLHSMRAAGCRHPDKAVSVPMAQFPAVYRQLGVVVYRQGILCFLTLFFLRSELPLSLDPRPPVLRMDPDLLGLNLHTEIYHQPLSTDIHRQDMPHFPAPGKGFSYRNFPPRLVAPSMPTAEATAKVHTPLWILWSFRGLGHTVIVFLPEGYFLVVKGRLYLPDIPVRVLHGREPQAIPQTFQSGLPLRRGWVVLPQEGFKFVSVPQMGLFRSRQALTGQKQAKKILKIPGQRIDAVPQRIGLINSKACSCRRTES